MQTTNEWQTQNLVPFGRYHLGARLATGGMGEVHLAKMKGAAGFEKRVVIKKILPQLSRDPDFVRRFIDEGKLAVKLSHANIVPVLDLGEVGGEYFLAMEYVDGADLREILRRLAANSRQMPLALAVFVLIETCKGLAYAHDRLDAAGRPLRIIHRDISPANIMVSRDGAVRLTDFGIAKAADRLSHSITGALQGKFLYMSPEQARGEKLDHRSDLFSLGSTAYELLTGQRPFAGHADLDTLERVKDATPTSIREVAPRVAEPVARVVHRLLAKRPEERYPTAEAAQRELQDYLFSLSSPAGEGELGAFVREILGPSGTPVPVGPAASLDELLSDEIDRKLGTEDPASRTATCDAGALANGATGEPPPAPATRPPLTATQTTLTSSNRFLFIGLVTIIVVLVVLNVLSLLDRRRMVPVPDAGASAGGGTPGGIGTATPAARSDLASAPAALTSGAPDAGLTGAAGSDRGGGATEKDADTARAVGPGGLVEAGATARTEVSGPTTTADTAPPALRVVRLGDVPAGAEVRVDGELVVPDDEGRIPIPAGRTARVEVALANYLPFERVVEPGDSPGEESIEVVLKPTRRTILVRTEPGDALLAIDGREAGPAPKRVTVAYGRGVTVRAHKRGYDDRSKTLRHGSPGTVTLVLSKREMGRVSFRFYPANAIVLIDRAVTRSSRNLVDVELAAGPHSLVIRSRDGSVVKHDTFDIEPGETNRLGEYRLEEPGRVRPEGDVR